MEEIYAVEDGSGKKPRLKIFDEERLRSGSVSLYKDKLEIGASIPSSSPQEKINKEQADLVEDKTDLTPDGLLDKSYKIQEELHKKGPRGGYIRAIGEAQAPIGVGAGFAGISLYFLGSLLGYFPPSLETEAAEDITPFLTTGMGIVGSCGYFLWGEGNRLKLREVDNIVSNYDLDYKHVTKYSSSGPRVTLKLYK